MKRLDVQARLGGRLNFSCCSEVSLNPRTSTPDKRQLICSLVLDHFGLMYVPQHCLSVGRLVGAALVFAGVLLVTYQ